MPEEILYTVDDKVATITINRPKVLNACTGENFLEIERLLEQAGADRDVGAIVLTGTGERAFCVGGDVNWEKGNNGRSGLQDAMLEFQLNRKIVECPKPVIARVNGYAIGAGNHIAYCCDLTIAADHAVFGQNGPRVGSPAGGFFVAHAASVLGQKRARELWLLCRKYTAQQALEWGLVNAVVPMSRLDAEVRRWADEMLALSPTCLKIIKRSFYYQVLPSMNRTMADLIAEVAPDFFVSGELEEGLEAFMQKRAPDFARFR